MQSKMVITTPDWPIDQADSRAIIGIRATKRRVGSRGQNGCSLLVCSMPSLYMYVFVCVYVYRYACMFLWLHARPPQQRLLPARSGAQRESQPRSISSVQASNLSSGAAAEARRPRVQYAARPLMTLLRMPPHAHVALLIRSGPASHI